MVSTRGTIVGCLLGRVRSRHAGINDSDLAASAYPDLIIVATAEVAGLTVLHLDKNFATIAEVTGQPVERLNP